MDLLVEKVGVGPEDLLVDLGSGDGRVLAAVASRTGCSGVGIEASARLVQSARVIAGECGVGDRVVFFHELIGWRGLGGATVVYAWLLPGVTGLLLGLAREALALGALRAVVLVGEAGELEGLGPVEVIGEVPVEGRIRVAGGVPVSLVRPRVGGLAGGE